MNLRHPLRTGTALSITVGIAYAACALVFWLWPSAAAAFTNALFHGLDFSRLQTGPAAFDFGGFVSALLVLMVWTLIFGTLFAWLRERLGFSAPPVARRRAIPEGRIPGAAP